MGFRGFGVCFFEFEGESGLIRCTRFLVPLFRCLARNHRKCSHDSIVVGFVNCRFFRPKAHWLFIDLVNVCTIDGFRVGRVDWIRSVVVFFFLVSFML